ncbi:protein TonB [Azomonas agilis]|uniref:Protein TonB n=1 Tax=Azomonas agilis TaxID=116849 RepID=A0A562IYA5_9GAMM|nr:energy transducer TonB [Azomonas agilis]TWH75947.1 protein TonB [Azomonas agilis]
MGSVLEATTQSHGLWYEARSPAELIEIRPPSIQQALHRIRFSAPKPSLIGRREAILLGVFALILHTGALYWLSQRPTPVLPEVPVQIPPMAIEFSSPAPAAEAPAVSVPTPPVVDTPPPPPVVDELAARKPPKPVVKPKIQPPAPPKPKPQPKAESKPVEPKPSPAPQPQTAVPAPSTPSTAPAAPASSSAPSSSSAPLTPASATAGYLRNPAPEYPALAQRRGWEGRVLLRVRVLPSGKPSEIQIQTSSGRDLLDQAAIQAVQRWSFVPAKRGDVAQEGWVSVPIDFKLH